MPVSPIEKTYALFATPANKKIIAELEREGAQIILFSTVETEEIEISPHNETLLSNLSAFDWIIFPTVPAVDYFLQALERLEIDFFELDALRICVFSETIADRLRFSQVHADVIANGYETTGIFQALTAYEPNFENSRFLIPMENTSPVEIVNLLSESGADVSELPIYRVQITESNELPKLKALVKGGAVDEFIFGAPEDVAHLALLFRPEKLSAVLKGITVSAKGAAAFQALREHEITQITMR